MTLSSAERSAGWALFRCPEHGDLLASHCWARVTCACGKHASPWQGKRQIRPSEAERLRRRHA